MYAAAHCHILTKIHKVDKLRKALTQKANKNRFLKTFFNWEYGYTCRKWLISARPKLEGVSFRKPSTLIFCNVIPNCVHTLCLVIVEHTDSLIEEVGSCGPPESCPQQLWCHHYCKNELLLPLGGRITVWRGRIRLAIQMLDKRRSAFLERLKSIFLDVAVF